MKIRIIRDKNFYRMVLSIMLPVAAQQAINMGVNMLDTMMLGSFGEIQLSASSLANQYYNFYTIFCMGIIGGSSVLAAQLMRSVGQAQLGLVVSIISFVVNVFANYVFIFGKFGAPRMEIAGTASRPTFSNSADTAARGPCA